MRKAPAAKTWRELFRLSINLVEFRRRSGEIRSNPVFRRGVYVAENTARGACVDLSAVSGQLKARSAARPPLSKKSLDFFDKL